MRLGFRQTPWKVRKDCLTPGSGPDLHPSGYRHLPKIRGWMAYSAECSWPWRHWHLFAKIQSTKPLRLRRLKIVRISYPEETIVAHYCSQRDCHRFGWSRKSSETPEELGGRRRHSEEVGSLRCLPRKGRCLLNSLRLRMSSEEGDILRREKLGYCNLSLLSLMQQWSIFLMAETLT